MIEAELKARLGDPDRVAHVLEGFAPGEAVQYRDTYYDTADGRFAASGQELRVRTVVAADRVHYLLTYKEPAVDAATDSKPEHETTVGAPEAIDIALRALGGRVTISFVKECTNHVFDYHGVPVLATVVRVPELEGTFLEVETQARPEEVDQALSRLRELLAQLEVPESDWTTQTYTDAVAAVRSRLR